MNEPIVPRPPGFADREELERMRARVTELESELAATKAENKRLNIRIDELENPDEELLATFVSLCEQFPDIPLVEHWRGEVGA